MKPFVAPTIFMMAISSRRSNVVSLMVLEMMNTDTTSRIAISAALMTLAMLRTVIKPLETASSARIFTMPGICSSASVVCFIWFRSVRCRTKRWRKMLASRSEYRSFSSYCST